MELKELVLTRKAQVAVVGLGYVGLPLSVALAKAGFKVLGVDTNDEWVQLVSQGISNIIDVTNEALSEVVLSQKLEASASYECISKANVIIICVPTPLNVAKEPDLSYIIKAMDGILPYLQKRTLISLESTTYPGTTDELIVSRVQETLGWKVGEDFYVCYSPERVDPGNKAYSVENTPKVIGGCTENCMAIGEALYGAFLPKVVPVHSTKVAEMSKVLENTFRCVNIALINEMMMMCERMHIDIWEVIKGASSKPFGFMPFYPGPGVGGHCIPLDPLYLSWEAKKYNYFSRFIEVATDINSNMPYFVVHQIAGVLCQVSRLIKQSKILLVGMSYKKDVGDLRESPALEIYELLDHKGAMVDFYDPYIEDFKAKQETISRIRLTEENISKYDLVVILTDHSCIDYSWLVEKAKLIFDTRNVCKALMSEKIYKLGQNVDCCME